MPVGTPVPEPDAGGTFVDAGSATDAGLPDSGGSVSDAGNNDAGNDAGASTDAGSDAGSSDAGSAVSCPGPFVLCEDFENGVGGTWTQKGTVALDTTHAHRGTHSVRFTGDNSELRTSQPFPTLSHDLWARVFVYMDELPPGSTTVNTGPNASFSWSAGNGGDTRVGFRHTRFSGGYNYPGYDFTNTDNLVWPLDQWVCVEWHYQSNDAGMGTQDYWMDGAPRPLMHFDAHPMPAFTYFWIGEYLFGLDYDAGSKPYDIWMDDLALDTQQIGCTR